MVVVAGVVVVVFGDELLNMAGGRWSVLQNSGVWRQRWIWLRRMLFTPCSVVVALAVVVVVVETVVVGTVVVVAGAVEDPPFTWIRFVSQNSGVWMQRWICWKRRFVVFFLSGLAVVFVVVVVV